MVSCTPKHEVLLLPPFIPWLWHSCLFFCGIFYLTFPITIVFPDPSSLADPSLPNALVCCSDAAHLPGQLATRWSSPTSPDFYPPILFFPNLDGSEWSLGVTGKIREEEQNPLLRGTGSQNPSPVDIMALCFSVFPSGLDLRYGPKWQKCLKVLSCFEYLEHLLHVHQVLVYTQWKISACAYK